MGHAVQEDINQEKVYTTLISFFLFRFCLFLFEFFWIFSKDFFVLTTIFNKTRENVF